jgi:hypothetical protein
MAMSMKRQREADAAAGAKVRADLSKVGEYFITDPDARNFGNIRVMPGQKTVQMTASQAAFFLGNGLSDQDPALAKTSSTGHSEEDAKAQADADAAAKAAADKARAEAKAAKPAGGDGEGSGTDGASATTPATKPAQRAR